MFYKNYRKEKELNKKNDAILKLYSMWLEIRQHGKSVGDYCKENGYNSVAIYGMHYLGESLCKDLEGTGIEIKYAIDRNANGDNESGIKVYTPEEELQKVDVVIVTAFYFFDEIRDNLCGKIDCPIISLEDLLYEL